MESPARSGTRSRRLRLACARCQKRKIRCDGHFPACLNCKKASAVCTDGNSLRLRSVTGEDEGNESSNQVIASLNDRIAALEVAVSERDARLAALRNNAPSGTEPQEAQEPSSSDPALLKEPESIRPAENYGGAIGHEIGLISVGNSSTPRYLGPSSGYFLSRILFDSASSSRKAGNGDHYGQDGAHNSRSSHMNGAFFTTTPAAASLPDKTRAIEIAEAFFETVHPQYPILHRPSFFQNLEVLYRQSNNGTSLEVVDPMISFHTFLVLAIGATIISQRYHASLPAESYFVSAMKHLEHISFECSIPGLQGLLLLIVFGMHNPRLRLNVWHLNYQCIALLLELGLQRNITGRPGMSRLEEQMRVRLFWVVYSLDRTIATIMGRPIGIRDEACDFRYPDKVKDEMLSLPNSASSTTSDATNTVASSSPPYIAYSAHLFKLAKINSEIKYVANSVVRDTPHYAYPNLPDRYDWQRQVLQQLSDWYQAIPKNSQTSNHSHHSPSSSPMELQCQLRYHSLVILLTRPSPAILSPTPEAFRICYDSCKESIHLHDRLYRSGHLIFSWTVFHGLLLSIITLLYCIRASSDIARSVEVESMILDVCKGLNVLSAAGEYWPGAKRSRNLLEDVLHDLSRWLKQVKSQPGSGTDVQDKSTDDRVHEASGQGSSSLQTRVSMQGSSGLPSEAASADTVPSFSAQQGESGMLGSGEAWLNNPFMGSWDITNPDDLDELMHTFFTDLDTPGQAFH